MPTRNISPGRGALRERRLAAGISQLELAQRAGCSPSMIGLLDRGYRPASSVVLERVEAVLNSEVVEVDMTPSTGEALGAQSEGFAKPAGGAARDARPA